MLYWFLFLIIKDMAGYRERVVNIYRGSSKQTRAVMHLTLTGWPGPDLPASPVQLLDAAKHVMELHAQQRSPTKPVLVHCKDGGSKSGTTCALVAAISNLQVTWYLLYFGWDLEVLILNSWKVIHAAYSRKKVFSRGPEDPLYFSINPF